MNTDAPERTHYADEETLEYIRKLEQERDRALAIYRHEGQEATDHFYARVEAEQQVRDLRAAIAQIRDIAAHELRMEGDTPTEGEP